MFKKILAFVSVGLGALIVLSAIFGLSLSAFLIGLGFALPGAWWLLHERKARSGSPMKRHWGIIWILAVVLVGAGGVITGPAETPESTEPTSASSVPASPSSSSASSTSETSSSVATSSAVEPTTERVEEQTAPAEAIEETTAQGPVGFMGAPGQSTPTPMEKVVESCGDVSLHEVGTTFFTDGTSGWTQQCADQMSAAAAQQQAVAPAPAEEPAYTGGGDAGTGNYVHPGSFCDGGTGVSKNGVPMVCAPGSDGRNRWQSA
ncbi:hypothetical protein ACUY3D_02695 [Corynebacterium guaraldiae]